MPALVALSVAGLLAGGVGTPAQAQQAAATAYRQPIDPQRWRNPDDMTWADYRAVPGTRWADPDVEPTQRTFKGALVLLDYPDEEFTVGQPAGSTLFGNPQPSASGIPRDRLPQFYEDFLNKPGALNHGHTINEYWMEDSGGRYGVDLTAFGVVPACPASRYQYGVEDSRAAGRLPGRRHLRQGHPHRRAGGVDRRRRRGGRRRSSTSSSTSPPGRTSRPPGRSSAR